MHAVFLPTIIQGDITPESVKGSHVSEEDKGREEEEEQFNEETSSQ